MGLDGLFPSQTHPQLPRRLAQHQLLALHTGRLDFLPAPSSLRPCGPGLGDGLLGSVPALTLAASSVPLLAGPRVLFPAWSCSEPLVAYAAASWAVKALQSHDFRMRSPHLLPSPGKCDPGQKPGPYPWCFPIPCTIPVRPPLSPLPLPKPATLIARITPPATAFQLAWPPVLPCFQNFAVP